MSAELETGLEAHPELEEEIESTPTNGDERPASSEPRDWTISALREKYDKGQVVLQPDYQREYVWIKRPELAPRLIESLLLQIPIPPVYFGKLDGGKLEVIDGQQRLTTLIRFVTNQFQLAKLQRMSSLNGRYFKDLSEEHQAAILDAPIRSVVIDAGANHNLRYDVFERLNRGSMALNEQELRNCVYRGAFCDLLAKLESEEVWRKVKGGTTPEPRFAEREMILRYFALVNRIEHYHGNLKRFLNDYMADYAPKNPNDIASQEAMFRQTLRNIYAVFGEHSCRLYVASTDENSSPDGKWDTKFSVAAFDIQASALTQQNPAKVQACADRIREAFLLYVLSNPEVKLAISRAQAGTSATRIRWFTFKAEVEQLLSSTPLEPRFFPYEFRLKLFEQSPICRLCGNQIHAFEDCAIDHILPYSKGGRTVTDNAQLAHRSCNARKCAKILIDAGV